MAITVGQLAAAIRLTDGADPPEPQLSMLTRLMGVADALIAMDAPEAPIAVRDEATIRLVAYLFDQPTSASGDRYGAAFRNSGASSLLSRWVVKRSGMRPRKRA